MLTVKCFEDTKKTADLFGLSLSLWSSLHLRCVCQRFIWFFKIHIQWVVSCHYKEENQCFNKVGFSFNNNQSCQRLVLLKYGGPTCWKFGANVPMDAIQPHAFFSGPFTPKYFVVCVIFMKIYLVDVYFFRESLTIFSLTHIL